QAAVFHVYDKLNLDRIPKRYIVEPNKTLDDEWDALNDNLGRYDLWVLGPNGYHRHFKGDAQRIIDSGVKPEIRVCYDIANGDVYVELMNEGTKDTILTVKPCAYRQDAPLQLTVKAGQVVKQHWSLADVGHWYDFEVTSESDPYYYRRFAGRVETGEDSFSDPAMI
ncbi:DUF756 domain-containing protein, partial [Acinetobacter baumannii]|nr:DUF756 domain-containing protein [Acinetobacter baumannii]